MYFSQSQNVFVRSAKCIFPNRKMFLSKLQNVSVQITKCICPSCAKKLRVSVNSIWRMGQRNSMWASGTPPPGRPLRLIRWRYKNQVQFASHKSFSSPDHKSDGLCSILVHASLLEQTFRFQNTKPRRHCSLTKIFQLAHLQRFPGYFRRITKPLHWAMG